MKQKVGGQQKLVGDESVFVDLNRGGRGCFFIRKKKNCLEKLIQISEFWSRYFFANAKAAPITPRIRPTKLITPKVKMLRRENTSTIIPHVFSFPGVYIKTALTMTMTPKMTAITPTRCRQDSTSDFVFDSEISNEKSPVCEDCFGRATCTLHESKTIG